MEFVGPNPSNKEWHVMKCSNSFDSMDHGEIEPGPKICMLDM